MVRYSCVWLVLLWVFATSASAVDWGEPTGDEQEMLWLMNRSRANPPADGVRMVNTTDQDVQRAIDFSVSIASRSSRISNSMLPSRR